MSFLRKVVYNFQTKKLVEKEKAAQPKLFEWFRKSRVLVYCCKYRKEKRNLKIYYNFVNMQINWSIKHLSSLSLFLRLFSFYLDSLRFLKNSHFPTNPEEKRIKLLSIPGKEKYQGTLNIVNEKEPDLHRVARLLSYRCWTHFHSFAHIISESVTAPITTSTHIGLVLIHIIFGNFTLCLGIGSFAITISG